MNNKGIQQRVLKHLERKRTTVTTYDLIAAQCGITRNQVKSCVERLRKTGVVIRTLHVGNGISEPKRFYLQLIASKPHAYKIKNGMGANHGHGTTL